MAAQNVFFSASNPWNVSPHFQELTHAWDQPHNDCLGAGCNFCTGSKFNPSLNGDSVSIGGDSLSVGRNGGGGGGGGNQWQGYHSHGQSYWRFKVDDVFFRVMVLDKEKAGVGARYDRNAFLSTKEEILL